jgi:putative membrane protein
MLASMGGAWGGGPWIGIVWFLLWALLIFGVVLLFRRRPGHWHHGDPAATALAERYARGEIDEDEYRKRRNVLRDR